MTTKQLKLKPRKQMRQKPPKKSWEQGKPKGVGGFRGEILKNPPQSNCILYTKDARTKTCNLCWMHFEKSKQKYFRLQWHAIESLQVESNCSLFSVRQSVILNASFPHSLSSSVGQSARCAISSSLRLLVKKQSVSRSIGSSLVFGLLRLFSQALLKAIIS